ncbi:MAG: heme lyase CcmF/NrfE family subunit [Alphaproteobacteria bacterium]|nr:heme lyase CcmF/NrfE family subunit [Alphaproteobacteria bacterium]MCB9692919.1 heme lyase CcmF/NrfE family subunit [Alphaproteobacteria bacterium]
MAALLFATLGSVMGFVAGSRYSERAWQLTRTFAVAFSGSMLAANLLMVYALLVHDFTVSYVAQVGSTESPTIISIISLWSSLEGSILFWGGVLALYVLAIVNLLRAPEYREYAPWALHVMLGIAIFFSLLVSSIADPFAYLDPDTLRHDWAMRGVAETGPGPNPLLQNHWLMAVHPPTLYLGYVGMAAPFSLICAALLAGRLDSGWMTPVRRWMLVPWAFLSVGIVLGGWWSYAVLGWGGAWAWDPVENASFMPWLTGTAFLHSAMVLQRRGLLRDWTLTLGLATFLLTMLGTFMTRSGVFNSVHSFTQSDIGPTFLTFIFITFVYSVVLLATRSHLLDREDKDLGALTNVLGPDGKVTPGSLVRGLLGREFAILVQNALFTVFTFTVLLGTVYPLLVEQFEDRRISVGEPYFDRWALPVGLAIVFMMGVGPVLPWGRMPTKQVASRFVPPVVVGAVLTGVIASMGMTKPVPLLAVFVSGFALWSNFNELLTPVLQRVRQKGENPVTATVTVVKRTRRRFGGHIAHYGVVLATFALALSRGYRVETDFNIPVEGTIQFQGYSVTFLGRELTKESHRDSVVARIHAVPGDAPDLSVMKEEAQEWSETSKSFLRRGVVGVVASGLIDAVAPRTIFEPKMNYYVGSKMKDPIWSPDVRSTFSSDLYFSLIEVPQDGKSVQLKLIRRPFMAWLWWSAPLILLGTIIAVWPTKRETMGAAA